MAPSTRSDPTRRALLVLAAAFAAHPARADALVVMAAASLKPALDEIAAGWDGPIALSYAGSGTVARQVAAGAPADVVLLAAVDWMDWLAGKGALAGAPVAVATNRLVLVGPPDAPPLALTPEALSARLDGGRFALGDPLSVPAGRYGEQALRALRLWPAVSDQLILAENVGAALAYVARGDVPLALVYRSDAQGTGVATVADIPAEAHDPIVYPGAVVAGAGPEARAFLDHVASRPEVFARHGFGA